MLSLALSVSLLIMLCPARSLTKHTLMSYTFRNKVARWESLLLEIILKV